METIKGQGLRERFNSCCFKRTNSASGTVSNAPTDHLVLRWSRIFNFCVQLKEPEAGYLVSANALHLALLGLLAGGSITHAHLKANCEAYRLDWEDSGAPQNTHLIAFTEDDTKAQQQIQHRKNQNS